MGDVGIVHRSDREILLRTIPGDADDSSILSGEEEGCVNDIFGTGDGMRADPDDDVAGLQTRLFAGSAWNRLIHCGGGTIHRTLERFHFHPNPAGAHFVETNEILADFFGSLDGQGVGGIAGFHAADEDADSLAVRIEQWRTAFTALHGDICANVRGGEKAALVFEIETTDRPERGREREIHGVTDGDDRRGDGQFLRITESQKGRLGVDPEDGDAAAEIADEPLGLIALARKSDLNIPRLPSDGVRGVERPIRVDEKTSPGKVTMLVDRLDAHDRTAALREDGLDFVLNGIEDRPRIFFRGEGLAQGEPPADRDNREEAQGTIKAL